MTLENSLQVAAQVRTELLRLHGEIERRDKRLAEQSKALSSYEDCIDGLNLRIAELERQLENEQRWRTCYSPMERT